MENAISVKNFSKSFLNKKVVSDLNFEVKEGELFAFLGPNGSGKTTTIRCLLNIIPKTSGELLIFGKPYKQDMSQLLGYLPEERGLYNNSSVKEIMVYFGQLKGLSSKQALKDTLAFLERVGLSDKLDNKIKTLSSGQQQKIQLGLTLINKPKLLILDEPTKGLDPVNRSLLLDILFELNSTNASTIFFSTHQMEEAEKIADRLLMLNNGTSVLYGSLKEVIATHSEYLYELEVDGDIKENDKLYSFRHVDSKIELRPEKGVAIEEIIKKLINDGVQLSAFKRKYKSLEEIFISAAKN